MQVKVVHDVEIARVLRRGVAPRLEYSNAARDAQPRQGGPNGAGVLERRVPADQHITIGHAEVACQRQTQGLFAAGHDDRLDEVLRRGA